MSCASSPSALSAKSTLSGRSIHSLKSFSPKVLRPRRSLVPTKTSRLNRTLVALGWTILLLYIFVIFFGEALFLPLEWCDIQEQQSIIRYPNPDAAKHNPCYTIRSPQLFGMSPFETDFSRRMTIAAILGMTIGFERKVADRPAGIRTMSLVCLGACFFTMCAQFAFTSSSQSFDSARVSAAIPSGVGFLGSALIWKQTVREDFEEEERHHVHGLTTACSVWLSASIGIGIGGRNFIISIYAVALVVFVLRLGPRMYLQEYYYAGDEHSFTDTYADDESSKGGSLAFGRQETTASDATIPTPARERMHNRHRQTHEGLNFHN